MGSFLALGGGDVMMTLGEFQFSVSTAAYQELSRTSEFRWPSQDRFGQDAALQFTGPGADTMSLPGVIYPEYRGGTGQVSAMRDMAGRGEPLVLIDGLGAVLGEWVIERIEERQSVFAAAGQPLKQEFTLQLRRFQSDGSASLLETVVNVASQTFPISDDIGASAKNLANTADKASGSALDGLNSALDAVNGVISDLAAYAGPTLAAVSRGINAAKTLQNAGRDAARVLGSVRSVASIPGAMSDLIEIGGRASNAASAAASVLKDVGVNIDGVALPGTSRIVRDAMITVNKFNGVCLTVRATANAIKGKAST